MAENEVVSGESKEASKLMKNPWIASTILIGLVCIVLMIIVFKPGATGNVIAGDTAGEKLVAYLNAKVSGGVGYVSSEDMGTLYKITVSYQNQSIPVYITKDGKYFVQGVSDITQTANATSAQPSTQTQAQQKVVKSAKPKVEAFVFAYCPYGLQFEKALSPVYTLLKDKADINIVFIGSMHGEFEHVESLRQLAILGLYGKDTLFAYLNEFDSNSNIGSCSGDAACLDKYLPAIYTKLGIDKAKVDAYMNSTSPAAYSADGARAQSLGVSGSPTLVINGAEVQAARNPAAIEAAICSAFNTSPSECSQTLSSANASPGFGATAAASSGSAGGCGA